MVNLHPFESDLGLIWKSYSTRLQRNSSAEILSADGAGGAVKPGAALTITSRARGMVRVATKSEISRTSEGTLAWLNANFSRNRLVAPANQED